MIQVRSRRAGYDTAGLDVTEAASHLACYDTAGIDITDGRWTRDA